MFGLIPVGWHQLRKQKGRLIVSLIGVAFANILIFVQLGILNSLFELNTMFHRIIETDAVVISEDAVQLTQANTFARSRLYQCLDVDGVESIQPVYIGTMPLKQPGQEKDTHALVIGFNPSSIPIQIDSVKESAHLLKIANTILFDTKARGDFKEIIEKLENHQDATMVMSDNNVRGVGKFKLGAAFNVDAYVLTSDQTFLRLSPEKSANRPSIGLISIAEDKDVEEVVKNIKARLPSDVMVFSKKDFIQFEVDYINKRSPISFIFTLGAVLGFLVGIAIVYQILSSDVASHLKQYATFKAIGFTDLRLFGIIFEEALILAVLGYIPGVVISLGVYQAIQHFANLPISMPVSRLILVFVLTLAMCSISGYIASRKLREVDPAEIF